MNVTSSTVTKEGGDGMLEGIKDNNTKKDRGGDEQMDWTYWY